MFKHLSLSCLLLTTITASSVIAAPQVGQVSSVVPDAFKSDKGCADDVAWKPAKFPQKFNQKNCFKTNDGGSVTLTLKSDNSTLVIGENSIVLVDSLLENDGQGNFIIKPKIQKGYMGFNVKSNEGHKVDFSTGTAAASIRGTKGVIGGDEKSFFVGLKDGHLTVFDSVRVTDSIPIANGQTVLGREKFLVLNLKSSGDTAFAKTLVTLLADSTLSLEELEAAVVKADSAYQESLASSAAASQAPADVANKEDQTTALKVPKIKYSSYDSLRCVANVSVSDVQGDDVRLSSLMDGTPIAEVGVKRNMSKRLDLRSGVHEYEFVVENSAGRNSVKKTLGCYPMKPFSIKLFGKKYESITIPPEPPIANFDGTIMQTVQFQIRVPENDPSFLNKVTVRQNGKVILQERLSQIQNLDYQIPVELNRDMKNRFDIEVIHKSGYVVKTSKVYGVSK
ncbi:FecR domain-containing protein [Fibrobacter sp. UWB12]|uniref:FecR domain-containing protein n=1 Tax=Fibrobacter sp. UWB12 TaxID=1896203 RepID=UPI0009214A93|nr:FecR domain-containing protein [Fibrobacter sp. UWB12]SHK36457.1 FecR family protein [Fibrobacter sp. UWB12]